ncbi:MAG: cystathionine gamma-synthase family protein [bacterium]|nr:cystathionine gamma-synthase family protein [bacterium]MCP5071096.1 cystathionine gamma-synthase family protein [bacterium]
MSKDRERERMIGDRRLRPESLMMSYGYDPKLSEGALKSPIFQTSTFVFESAEAGKAFFEVAYGLRQPDLDEEPGLIYSRLNNPDLEILEERLALWDGAEEGAVFVSGMAAIATSLLAYARPGDVIVHSGPLYGGTDHLLRVVLSDFGIRPIGFPAGVPVAELASELREKIAGERVAAVIIETPANPTNALVDIQGIAELVKAESPDAMVMVDNTFLGPLWQQPLQHGADLVIYSATKFIGGHSDVIAGAALGSREALAPIRGLRTFLGTLAGPWSGWLLLRSLETLSLRMQAQARGAQEVAAFLVEHPQVRAIHYLGTTLEDDPMADVYYRQCRSAGSVISFDIHGGEKEAFRFLNALQLVKLAVSLGGTESLAEHPASMTHADVSREQQRSLGIGASMVRLSVGIEHPADLIADLEQALEQV